MTRYNHSTAETICRLKHLIVLFDMLSDDYQLVTTIAYIDDKFPQALSGVLNARKIIKIEKEKDGEIYCHFINGNDSFEMGTIKRKEIEAGIEEIRGFLRDDLKEQNRLN